MDIMIFDDHPLMRSGIISMLHQKYPTAHFKEAGYFQQVQDLLSEKKFDLCILDQNLPEGKGTDFLPQIASKVPVLMLTMFEAGDLIKIAMERGAKGFVSKGENPQTLLAAISTVLHGKTWFPELNQRKTSALTDREMELMRELLNGKTVAVIAQERNITQSSVQSYKKRIFIKLHVTNMIELARLAMETGLL